MTKHPKLTTAKMLLKNIWVVCIIMK